MKALAGRQPQRSGDVLTNVVHELDRVPRKRLSLRFKSVEELAASDPKYAMAILEESADEDSTEAVRMSWIVSEDFEVVGIVPVQPILRAKPHETLSVLQYLGHLYLRQPLRSRETLEPKVCPVDNGQPEYVRLHAGQRYCAVADWPMVRPHRRQKDEKG